MSQVRQGRLPPLVGWIQSAEYKAAFAEGRPVWGANWLHGWRLAIGGVLVFDGAALTLYPNRVERWLFGPRPFTVTLPFDVNETGEKIGRLDVINVVQGEAEHSFNLGPGSADFVCALRGVEGR